MTTPPIRGIRQSVPPGTVLARLSGTGPLVTVSLADLTTAIVRTGKVATTGGEWTAGGVSALDQNLTIVSGTLDLVTNSTQLRTVAFPIVGMPPAQQKYSVVVTQDGYLLANGGSAAAYIPTNPAAATGMAIETIHNGTTTSQGTITVSTGGIVTFPTFAAVGMSDGDVIQLVNAAVQDTVFADPSFSLQYAVTGVLAMGFPPEWTAGTVSAVGGELTITAGTLSAPVPNWTAGTVTAIGTGLTIAAGTISSTGGTQEWTGGTVTAIGGELVITAGTLSAPASEWTAGTVSAIGGELSITSGTLSAPAAPAIASTNPIMDGIAAPGTLTTVSAADHIHPVDTSRAALAGLSTQVFSAAIGTTTSEVVTFGQFGHPISSGSSTSGTAVSTTTAPFTAPSNGWLRITAFFGASAQVIASVALSTSLAGFTETMGAGAGAGTTATLMGYLPMNTGQSTTVTANSTSGSTASLSVGVEAFFIPGP